MIRILLSTILLFIAHKLLPFWGWIMIVPALVMAATVSSARRGFWSGFVSGVLAWGLMATFKLFTTASSIAEKMADVLFVKTPFFLLLTTIFLGGLLAGLGGGFGASFRALIRKPKR